MPEVIAALTPEQEADLPRVRDEWLRVGLSTDPVDRAEADAAVAAVYEAAGLPPPLAVIHLSGPLHGAAAALMVGDQVLAQVWDQVWDQVRAQVREQVGDQVLAQVGKQLLVQVGDQVLAQVWDQVRAQVREQVGDQVLAQVWSAIYGGQEAGWLSFYEFFYRHFGLAEEALGLMRLARAAGWVWPFKRLAIVTARPTLIRLDDERRLHAEDGPAILYGDGLAVHAWHGTRIPGEWVEQRRTIDPAVILAHPHVEQRAAGMALIGWPRAMAALDCRVIDHDPDPSHGDLIELSLPGLPVPGRFLRAMCPRNGLIVEGVPRADARGRPIETVRAAQAWRVGLAPEEFAYPQRRT